MSKIKKLFGFFIKKSNITGIGNGFYLIKENGDRVAVNSYPGIFFKCTGANNSIEIEEGSFFEDCKIIISGFSNSLRIKKTKKFIRNLEIDTWGAQHTEILIKENFQCAGLSMYISGDNKKVEIGRDCMFSWGVQAWIGASHSIIDKESGRAHEDICNEFIINDKVWVGCNVIFTKAIVIGGESVIGAGSIVSKNYIESGCLIAGNPALVRKKNIKWDYAIPSWYNAVIDNEVTQERLGYWVDVVKNFHLKD